jgi:hypothetical protein
MGSAVVRPWVRGLVLLAGSWIAAGAIGVTGARAAEVIAPGCPGSFPYTKEFRFPPAAEGFAPDCTVTLGSLTIDAVSGRPDVAVELFGSGVAVDVHGRLDRFELPAGPTFDVARRGRPLASVSDSSQHFALTYNRAGRLKTVSTDTLAYNAAGLVNQISIGPDVVERFKYNSSGRVVAYSDRGGDTGKFTYSAGHLASAVITSTEVDPSYSYTYRSGRLSSWTSTDTTSATTDLTLNSAGDVSAVTQGATTETLTYARPHVLTNVTDGSQTLASFTYNGAHLSSAAAGSGGTTTFGYNARGRFSSATYPAAPSSASSVLKYDSLGRLVKLVGSDGEQITLVYVAPPAARTKRPIHTGKKTATLTGSVNPHGLPAEYRFQFGKTKRYGHSTRLHSAGNGKLPVTVVTSLGRLAPATTYHYRLIAVTAAGSRSGADRTFRTKK